MKRITLFLTEEQYLFLKEKAQQLRKQGPPASIESLVLDLIEESRHRHPVLAPAEAAALYEGEALKVLRRLKDPAPLELAALLGMWRTRSPERWAHTPEIYQRLGDRVLKMGEPLLAHDILAEGLEHWPKDVRLRQLLALALARSRATHRANGILLQLYQEGHTDGETTGILARTYKDLWAMATDPVERQTHLQAAYKFYSEAYRLAVEKNKVHEGYYTGINAATLALLLGEKEVAHGLAREVRALCLQELKRLATQGDATYWIQATLGEAALILGEWSEAEDWYTRASEAGRGRLGDLSSTRRNARLLVEHLGGDKRRIEGCFRIPRIAVFVGHMIDQPGRALPRFPPQLEQAVREALRSRLQKLDIGLGYASAACGSDILFLETVLELKGEVHIVLPYGKDQFVKDSVEILPGTDWGARFERLLQRAAEVLVASGQRPEGDRVSYDYANLLLQGLASVRAEQLETELVPLAVWDGRPGDGPGGTASVVRRWQRLDHKVALIDLAQLLRQECPELAIRSDPTPPAPSQEETKREAAARDRGAPRLLPPAYGLEGGPGENLSPSGFATQIMALMFADTVKFSRLTEVEIPRFVRHFLGAITGLVARSPHAPVMKETYGDGLYFVFSSVRDAGQFALELCELVGNTNWAEKGLPKDMNLRIALHVGPVYTYTNPMTGQPACMGTHVNRVARMEPITPPGQVYASQEFAALASAERIPEFTCDYVGQTPLAKGYGTFPTYHVRRRNP